MNKKARAKFLFKPNLTLLYTNFPHSTAYQYSIQLGDLIIDGIAQL